MLKARSKRTISIFLLSAVFCLLLSSCENPFMQKIMDFKTVSFNTNGGSSVPSQNLIKGRKITRPADPVKFGADFDGWYIDNDAFLYEWDFDDIPAADMTLHARWTGGVENRLQEWIVTFEADGGTPAPGQQPVAHEGLVTEPDAMTKTGHYFDGWYKEEALIVQWNFAEDIVTSDITLYAKWVSWSEVNKGMDGSPEKPFKVYDEETLRKVGTETDNWTLDANYELVEDIKLTQPEPDQSNWTPIGKFQPFTGTFNGNGNAITDLNAMSDNEDANQGMFGKIASSGTVKNLTLVNCIIAVGRFAGGVAGANEGTVISCSVSGSIIGRESIGGVVGSNEGTVQNCYSTANVSSWGSNIGGVVGNNEGTVQNCYSTGTVEGSDYVGGIVGGNSGTVQNCVALNMSITATEGTLGRVVGKSEVNTASLILRNNYGKSDMLMTEKEGTFNTNEIPNELDGTHGMGVSSDDYSIPTWWTATDRWSSGGVWDFTTVWVWDTVTNLPILLIR